MPTARPSFTTRSSISRPGVHLHRAARDLVGERLVGAEEQLLTGLAAGVERARHLRAAERPVVEQAAVLAGERHTLRHALVDDVDAHLGEAVHVALAGAEVAALHRVVEEAVDAVAVVRVVLGRVDAALRGDAVRTARRVVEGEQLHPVAELTERRRGGGAGETAPDDDHLEAPLVRRVHQLHVELVLRPLLGDRARKGSCASSSPIICVTTPVVISNGMLTLPTVMTTRTRSRSTAARCSTAGC